MVLNEIHGESKSRKRYGNGPVERSAIVISGRFEKGSQYTPWNALALVKFVLECSRKRNHWREPPPLICELRSDQQVAVLIEKIDDHLHAGSLGLS